MMHQSQLSLFEEAPEVETLRDRKESPYFERKSACIEAKDLAKALVAFANADGGLIVIGIHNREIEGVDSDPQRINEWLRTASEQRRIAIYRA